MDVQFTYPVLQYKKNKYLLFHNFQTTRKQEFYVFKIIEEPLRRMKNIPIEITKIIFDLVRPILELLNYSKSSLL